VTGAGAPPNGTATMTPRPTCVALRPPDHVMRLARLGAFHQTRLSFMRALLRALKRDGWRFDRPLWRVDERGEGVAVYAARGPRRTYSLACFAHDLDPAKRTDRVIAEAWDATFALVDGEATEDDIARLAANVPKQEAGRCTRRELVLSRANRSVRLFEHVVDCLAAGRQPAAADLAAVGYLMRTTAVYGSGKFGLADREAIADRPEFAGPFRAEMLSVWLTRAFTVDIVEHMARMRAPSTAVRLATGLRRTLGLGNATGLGMAPFLVNHPLLVNNWIEARETALARVRALATVSAEQKGHFRTMLTRAAAAVGTWRVEDSIQAARIVALRRDIARIAGRVEQGALDRPDPWDGLVRWSDTALSLEGQELLVSLAIEPHGELVDDLADRMAADEAAAFRIDGAMHVRALRQAIAHDYGWALGIDYAERAASARFWYVSEEKLEPRLGERYEEEGAALEQPLAVGRDVAALHEALGAQDGETVAAFLLAHPALRHVVRRVQIGMRHPYAEIRDNLIGAAMRPIDLLRCKLSFFGATRFDPKSDRWIRITLFQNAPYPDELADSEPDDWAYPPLAGVGDDAVLVE
jgi:hypothetical protein